MTILQHVNRTRAPEIEGLRRRLADALYEHHGIGHEERKTWNQLDGPLSLSAIAPVVAALLVVTGEPMEAGAAFLDLVRHHVEQSRQRTLPHIPILGRAK